MTLITDSTFDGLAFPVITVKLGNGRAVATMPTPDGIKRARLTYTYDMPDGERFAVRAARKLWQQHAESEPIAPGDVVMIPGDAGPGRGYTFTVVSAGMLNR